MDDYTLTISSLQIKTKNHKQALMLSFDALVLFGKILDTRSPCWSTGLDMQTEIRPGYGELTTDTPRINPLKLRTTSILEK
ncbi:MAG: hypothetical protein ACTHYC_05410 [Sphingobacterium sp.]